MHCGSAWDGSTGQAVDLARARFFGHEPQADKALLEKGFHVVYADVSGLFGAPKAVAIWDSFYQLLTEKHGFASKAALEGMSRGGLIIYNWAAKNPDKVSCIYADAPVCDFKSWPGGKGRSEGSRGDWEKCLKAYGLSEEQGMAYKMNPIDNLEPLAKAKNPSAPRRRGSRQRRTRGREHSDHRETLQGVGW